MQVVGIDFGTTNVRISTWDSTLDLPPQPQFIGQPATTTMPAVIALRREPGGAVSMVVGEEADESKDTGEIVVIRNIKRLALSRDPYVDWHLEVRNSHASSPQWPPPWWNGEEGQVEVWGERFSVWDLIKQILEEAMRRAALSGEFEWRTGCPVHAGLEYREELARTLSDLTGKGNVNWVLEEPILFLILALRLGTLGRDSKLGGSYLVYDFGGGSFDCALVDIQEGASQMLVYGADGHPLLGGSDIDEVLTRRLAYEGQPSLLRQAKERLTPSNPSDTVNDGTADIAVTWADVEDTLRAGRFVERSISTMRDAYISAKVLWKRDQGDAPPIGEIISRDRGTGAIRFIWQSTWEDLAKDVNGILLCGGSTRSPYFYERLVGRFGADKIITAAELLPQLTGIPDLELVGISMGACYSFEDSYSPLYLSRLPACVTLQDLQTGDKVEYEPYQHFEYRYVQEDDGRLHSRHVSRPFAPFVSEPLSDQGAASREYELTVTYPNGIVIEQHSLDEYLQPRRREGGSRRGRPPFSQATSLRLVIDRFGRVGVERHSQGKGLSMTETFVIVKTPPWQTHLQQAALETEGRRVIETIRQADFAGPATYSALDRQDLTHPTGYPRGRRA